MYDMVINYFIIDQVMCVVVDDTSDYPLSRLFYPTYVNIVRIFNYHYNIINNINHFKFP